MSEETRQKAVVALENCCDGDYAQYTVDALTAHVLDEVRATCKQDLQVPPPTDPPEERIPVGAIVRVRDGATAWMKRRDFWIDSWKKDSVDGLFGRVTHDYSSLPSESSHYAVLIEDFVGDEVGIHPSFLEVFVERDPEYKPAEPPAERMSEDRLDWLKGVRSCDLAPCHVFEIWKELDRARAAESNLQRTYQTVSDLSATQTVGIRERDTRIAALEFWRDGLISERDGLKVAHKVLENAIDHCNDIIDRKDTCIAELERSNAAYRDSWKACMDESCAGELHCTCVPGLRERVRVLEGDLATARGLLREWQPAHNWQGVGNPAINSKACDCDLCERTRAFLAAKENGNG